MDYEPHVRGESSTESARAAETGSCATTAERPRLGEILLATGKISERQLQEALRRKRESGRRIGEELVASGSVSKDLIDRALAVQRRLVLAASLAALSPINAFVAGEAAAAEGRAYMTVTATVVDTVTVRPVHQERTLTVTAQDVDRGYVDVQGASRVEIRNSRPCLFEFRPLADNVFRSVRVSGVQGTAEFGAEGATLLQTGFANAGKMVDIGSRFELAPGVRPGSYAWPVALTVLPL
jgi:hypothetical protein